MSKKSKKQSDAQQHVTRRQNSGLVKAKMSEKAEGKKEMSCRFAIGQQLRLRPTLPAHRQHN